jgi:hypothetical protein
MASFPSTWFATFFAQAVAVAVDGDYLAMMHRAIEVAV